MPNLRGEVGREGWNRRAQSARSRGLSTRRAAPRQAGGRYGTGAVQAGAARLRKIRFRCSRGNMLPGHSSLFNPITKISPDLVIWTHWPGFQPRRAAPGRRPGLPAAGKREQRWGSPKLTARPQLLRQGPCLAGFGVAATGLGAAGAGAAFQGAQKAAPDEDRGHCHTENDDTKLNIHGNFLACASGLVMHRGAAVRTGGSPHLARGAVLIPGSGGNIILHEMKMNVNF